MKILPSTRGFTLIEIIITLVLLGIVTAVAVPKFTDLIQAAKNRAVDASIAEVQSGITTRFGKALLQGSSCGDARSAAKKVNTSGENATSWYGDVYFDVDEEELFSQGETLVVAYYTAEKIEPVSTNAKLFLPLCDSRNGDSGSGGGESETEESIGAEKNYTYEDAENYEPYKKYYKGDIVLYNGIYYVCDPYHGSVQNYPPDYSIYDWKAFGSESGEAIAYSPHTKYELGTTVTHNGKKYMYICTDNNNNGVTGVGYTPDSHYGKNYWVEVTPEANLKKPPKQTNPKYEGILYKYDGGTYKTGDTVWYKGQYYIAKTDFTTYTDAATAFRPDNADYDYWELASD